MVSNDKSNPLVSICCVTYNHERFIGQCLDGFVMQKTNFVFEVLVHEDASVDKTAEIVKEYEIKYPHLFRCVYQYENQFKKQNTLINILFPMALGKYIALCEGDDYWTDPLKLQKQIDFLESYPSYVLSFHNVIVVDSNGRELKKNKIAQNLQRDRNRQELIAGLLIPTISVVFRNRHIDNVRHLFIDVKNGDTFLFALLGQFGEARFHSDILGTYREHGHGIWSSQSLLQKKIDLVFTLRKLLSIIKVNVSLLRYHYLAERYELAKLHFKNGDLEISKRIFNSLLIDSLCWFRLKIFSIALLKRIQYTYDFYFH